MVARCEQLWKQDPYAHETWVQCEKIQHVPLSISGNIKVGQVNQYDIRLYDTTAGGEWPWRTTGEKEYLNRHDVRKALNVETQLAWTECSDEVEAALTHEDMYPTHRELQSILPYTRVLLYNGQFDWICNHMGVERFIAENLEFNGKDNFIDSSQRGLWVSGSRLAGYAQSGGNMTFVLVLGGSHMVPMDKRPESLDLLHRFMSNQSFKDIVNNISGLYEDHDYTVAGTQDNGYTLTGGGNNNNNNNNQPHSFFTASMTVTAAATATAAPFPSILSQWFTGLLTLVLGALLGALAQALFAFIPCSANGNSSFSSFSSSSSSFFSAPSSAPSCSPSFSSSSSLPAPSSSASVAPPAMKRCTDNEKSLSASSSYDYNGFTKHSYGSIL